MTQKSWRDRKIDWQIGQLLGHDDACRDEWMARSNPGLLGMAPADLVRTIYGKAILMRYLDAALKNLSD